jgi:hypothetical protein
MGVRHFTLHCKVHWDANQVKAVWPAKENRGPEISQTHRRNVSAIVGNIHPTF